MRHIQDISSKSVKEHSLDLNYPTFLLLFSTSGINDILKADGNVGSLEKRTKLFSQTPCAVPPVVGEQNVGLVLLSSSVFGQNCNAAVNQKMLLSGLGWYCKKEKQGKKIMASVAARTGVWEWGTNVCQEQKEQNWWGERDHFKSLRGYCKQWRKKEKPEL